MAIGASVAIGGPLDPDEERELRVRQNRIYLAETEAAIDVIEAHLRGTGEALTAKRAEAEQLRAALQEDEG